MKATKKGALKMTLAAVLLVVSSIGCGGDSDPGIDDGGNVEQQEYGLISYDFIRARMTPTDGQPKSSSAGTGGDVISGVNDILNIGALVFPALGPIAAFNDWISAGVNGRKINNEINEIVSAVAGLQGEVENLQKELNFLGTDFMDYIAKNAQSDEAVAYNNFTVDIAGVTSNSTGSFWLFVAGTKIDPKDPTTPVDYSQLVANIDNINTELESITADQNVTSIDNISGSHLPIETNWDPNDPKNPANKEPYTYITPMTSPVSTVELLFLSMRKFLYINFPTFNSIATEGSSPPNIAPGIEEYNNQILYIFEIVSATLQAAYTVDASINQINYYQGQSLDPDNPPPNPVTELETNIQIYYSYDQTLSSSTNATYYELIQKQLALVYAKRYAMLYDLAVEYIISDQPFSTFSYPSMTTGNTKIDTFYKNQSYEDYYKKTVPSSQMATESQIGVLGKQFPEIKLLDSSEYVFYLYTGLNEFASCQNAFLEGTDLDTNNCPSIYDSYNVAKTPGVYDGTNLQVWSARTSSANPVLTYKYDLNGRCRSGDMTDSYWVITAFFNNIEHGFSCKPPANIIQGIDGYSTPWNDSYSPTDPHAKFYWNATGMTFEFAGEGMSEHVYDPEATSFEMSTAPLCKDWLDDDTTPFASAGIYLNSGYYTGLYILLDCRQPSWDMDVYFEVSCTSVDPLCYATSVGLCIGGTNVKIIQSPSNTATLEADGDC